MKVIGLLVLLGLVSLVGAEVVTSFSPRCHPFFIKDQNNKPIIPTVPGGQQYKFICQKYKNVYRYATLYNPPRRIPVYSAYVFIGYTKTKPRSWMIEPQVGLLSFVLFAVLVFLAVSKT